MAAMATGIPMPIMEMAVTRGGVVYGDRPPGPQKGADEGACGDGGEQQSAAGRPVLGGGEDGRDDGEAARTDLAEAAGESQGPKCRLLHDFAYTAEET